MNTGRLAALALVCGTCLASARPSAHAVSTLTLLDRYAGGEFEAVAEALVEVTDFNQLRKELKDDATAWIAAGEPADRARRELAAATFALEAARVAEWREWKWVQRQSQGPLPVLYWKPAPLLVEWGCELLRKDTTPRAIERVWQLAALAVALRSEDPQFLIGNTEIAGAELAPTSEARRPPIPQLRVTVRPNRGLEVLNTQDEISHLAHVRERFPAEMRFVLAEGIARDRVFPEEAALAYRNVAGDPDVGGEAAMRLGALYARQNRAADAIAAFDRAERLTRDTYVIHLARFFRGQMLLRQKREPAAIDAFRGALAARPGAQSASVALAELLFKAGHRTEAQQIMAAVLAADPAAGDPYLEHVHGDDRFWPELIAQLRREIKP